MIVTIKECEPRSNLPKLPALFYRKGEAALLTSTCYGSGDSEYQLISLTVKRANDYTVNRGAKLDELVASIAATGWVQLSPGSQVTLTQE